MAWIKKKKPIKRSTLFSACINSANISGVRVPALDKLVWQKVLSHLQHEVFVEESNFSGSCLQWAACFRFGIPLLRTHQVMKASFVLLISKPWLMLRRHKGEVTPADLFTLHLYFISVVQKCIIPNIVEGLLLLNDYFYNDMRFRLPLCACIYC